MRRLALGLLLLLGCRRDAPAPAAVASASATSAPSAAAPPASASVTPLRVEARPVDAVLADPTGPAAPRMSFAVAVGLPGVLRMELVDRVNDLRSMLFEPRDPRCIFIDEVKVETPRVVPVSLTFVRRDGALRYEVVVPNATFSGPVAKERLPAGDLQLRAAAITEPVALTAGHHVVVGAFAWASRDAGAPDPFVLDEKASAPHWAFRLRFEPMKTKKP